MKLKDILKRAAQEAGASMNDLTVLSDGRDPYRIDTPANHALGQWLRDAYAEVLPDGRRIHVRGLHYALVGRVNLPASMGAGLYINNADTWDWLMSKVVPAARWLGYLPWDAIRDGRNAEPTIFTPWRDEPEWELRAGEVELVLPDVLEPRFRLKGDLYIQPYRQVIIAEKQGVQDLLLPLCEQYEATLCLPAGEVSATMLHDVMRRSRADGRPLVVHQLGDADPSGWQMAVSTARKLQALHDQKFPDVTVLVHAPALTAEQADEWNLPTTPLKDTEKRGDRWLEFTGREQTELDAAVALKPEEFVATVRALLEAYWDDSVDDKNDELRDRLEAEANAKLEQALGVEKLAEIRALAETKLAKLQGLRDEVNAALVVDFDEAGVESPRVPPVTVGSPDEDRPEPLYDSTEDWATATAALKARKSY